MAAAEGCEGMLAVGLGSFLAGEGLREVLGLAAAGDSEGTGECGRRLLEGCLRRGGMEMEEACCWFCAAAAGSDCWLCCCCCWRVADEPRRWTGV